MVIHNFTHTDESWEWVSHLYQVVPGSTRYDTPSAKVAKTYMRIYCLVGKIIPLW